jgi:subtilase family serine protease/flagellar hook assembly protein FlgD
VGVLLFATPNVAHPTDVGKIAVLQHDGSPYQRSIGGQPNEAPRQAAARAFYASHRDAYDFLIVFPTFAYDLSDSATGAEMLGLHSFVRNDITGIGQQVGDLGPSFGSAAQLKGYIDINSLVPGVVDSSFDTALGAIAHESAHQWSGRASFIDPGTGAPSLALLGQDQAHWSFFLDSNASVLYGSRWQPSGPGSFSAIESMRRYSALDLYLMGFLAPSEVAPLTLIRPAVTAHAATDLPPPDGTAVQGTAQTVTIDQLIQAMGPRNPSISGAQATFRAAFALLVGPGQKATPEQIALVDSLRREWANRFFFMTQGRAVMETDLVEPPPAVVASNPSVQLGLSYLLATQLQDGSWGDGGAETARETQAALEALALFRSQPGVAAAIDRGGVYLAALAPADVDTSARRDLGLRAAVLGWIPSAGAPHDLSSVNLDGGKGLASGYQSTIVDTLLAALAARSPSPDQLAAATQFLLRTQNGDGGWSWLVGSVSDLSATALTLRVLATAQQTPQVMMAVDAGLGFLGAHRGYAGDYRNDLSGEIATAEVVLALDTWQRLSAGDAGASESAILATQEGDGSWYGSPYQTAQALRALRCVTLPNLVVRAADVTLASSSATEGETVQVRVIVRNTGHGDASQVAVRAYDSGGQPFGTAAVIPAAAAGSTSVAYLTLDTTGHAGSTQAFFVVDPEGTIDEARKDDNRAAVDMSVVPRPQQPDLFVSAGSLIANPPSISRVGTTVTVTARVGNVGRTDVAAANVALLAGATSIANTSAAFPAASDQTITLTGVVPAGSAATLTVLVDPQNAIAEARKDNNTAQTTLTIVPTVDLAVSQVAATPNPVDQGRDSAIQFQVTNRGTADALPTNATVSVLDSAGMVLATLPGVPLTVPSGGAVSGRVIWRASNAAAALVRVDMPYASDLDSSDNSVTASLSVSTSGLPNLLVKAGGVSVQPSPALEGQPATTTVIVRNAGNSAAGAFGVDLWLGDPAQGGVKATRALVPELAAAAETSVPLQFTPPSGSQLTLVAVVDSDNEVAEFDESDNTAVLVVESLSLPDVAIADADLEPQALFPREGSAVPVKVSVSNLGRQDAAGVTVRLYEGAPETGGTLVGTAALPAVPAQGRAAASFTWIAGAASGVVQLVAVVTADRASDDARADNDRAVRSVAIQSGAVALSNPYFSPDGNAVKDATEILYSLREPGTVEAKVTDARGRVLRTLRDPSGDALEGALTWDGRGDSGRVVRDGTYRVTVAAGDQVVGAASVVVDTNRSSVVEAPPELVLPAAFDDALRRVGPPGDHARSIGVAGSTPDEAAIVTKYVVYDIVYEWPWPWWGQYRYKDCGYFRVPTDGGDPVRLTPASWIDDAFCGAGAGRLTLDGRSVVYYDGALKRFDIGTQVVVTLATKSLDGWALSASSIELAPDGGAILFDSNAGVEAMTIDGSRRWLVTATPAWGKRSPDLAAVAYGQWNEAAQGQELHVSALDGSGDRAVLVEKPQRRCLEWEGGESFAAARTSAALRAVVRPGVGTAAASSYEGGPTCIQWASEIAAPPPGAVVLADGVALGEYAWASPSSIAYLADDLSLLDLTTGETRLLVPALAMPFQIEQLAADPSGEWITFLQNSWQFPQLWVVSTAGGLPQLTFDWSALGVVGASSATFSRQGTMLWESMYASSEASPSDSGAVRSLATLGNLSVSVTGYRRPSSAALTFRGTAVDLNFESWELAVQRQGVPRSPIVVARGTEPAIGAELAQWTPPEAGTWEVTLTASDRAGNVRSASALASFTEIPAIANVVVAPKYISPNGDGRQDQTTVSYSVQEPISTGLVVSSLTGGEVRTLPVTHVQTGSYTKAWDGRDNGGAVVPDGAYRLTLGAQQLDVVVDDTLPTAALRTMGTAPEDALRLLFFPYEERYHAPEGCQWGEVPFTDRQKRWLHSPLDDAPVLALGVELTAHDEHLSEWMLEATTSDRPASFRPFTHDTVDVPASAPASVLRGQLPGELVRLRARDLASNEAISEVVTVPERIVVKAYGAGQFATPCLGWIVPVIRPSVTLSSDNPFLPHDIPGVPLAGADVLPFGVKYFQSLVHPGGGTGGFCFEPAFHGFWIEHTIREPIVAASILYREIGTGETAWSVDQAHVAITPFGIVTWDARSYPQRLYDVQVQLLDARGRTFVTPVPTHCTPKAPVFVSAVGCSALAAFDTNDVRLTIIGKPADVDRTLFVLRDQDTAARLPLVGEATDTTTVAGDGTALKVRSFVARLDPDALPGCRYDVVNEPPDDHTPYRSFDVCGLRAEHLEYQGDALVLSLGARYRQPISSVDLFLGSDEARTYAATVPGFARVSQPVAISLRDRACGVDVPLTAVVHFADGSTRAASLAEKGACKAVAVDPPCLAITLQTSRDATPLCAGQPGDYRITASAQSRSGKVEAISILALSGEASPAVLGTAPFTPAAQVSVAATFATADFADGTWAVTADATDDVGGKASGVASLVVDRTPPYLELIAPATNALVCPVQRAGRRVVRVEGNVDAARLESYSFLLRCGSGTLLPVKPLPASGSLGEFDVTDQPSSDCQLALEGRNRAGASYCTAPVPFHLVNGARVSASAEPALLSPNGDGVRDGLVVRVAPDEPSRVTITATDAAGRSGVVFQGDLPAGSSPLAWDGTILGSLAADGWAKLQVSAFDRCGNEATATIAARVDVTSPLARIDAPAGGTRVGGLALVTGEVSDEGGLERYELSIGAGAAPVSFRVAVSSYLPASGFLGAVPMDGLPDGIYTVRLWAVDLAGNEATTAVQIEVARKQLINTFAVSPALVSPNGDGILDGATATFQLLGDAAVTLDVVDGAGQVVRTLLSSGPALAGETQLALAWQALGAIPLDGDYRIRLRAISPAGIDESELAPLAIDRVKPAIALLGPAPGAVVPGSGEVTAAVSDVHLEGWTLALATDTAPSKTIASGASPVDGLVALLDGLPEGDYRLVLDGNDSAGNKAHAEVAFASDVTPPIVSIDSPAEGAFVGAAQGPVEIIGDARDAHLADVQLSLTSSGAPPRMLFSGPPLPAAGALVAWDVREDPEGSAELALVAVDAAGNRAEAHRTVVVDHTPPVAVIASPRDTYLRQGDAVFGTATDSNLASWTLELASGPPALAAMWAPLASGSEPMIDVLTSLASLPRDGLYALRLTVTDRAGNVTTDTAAFLVDTTPPRPPPTLTATLHGGDVVLNWGASPDGDVVAYHVLRAAGEAGLVPVAEVPGLTATDVAIADGSYRYVVVAIDGAGLVSEPSPTASITIDRTPPMVAIERPATGSAVSGTLHVTGTAWSPADFKEYRLSIGAGAAPTTFVLVRRSGVPVIGAQLGTIDTGALVDGSVQTIRLEAEDLKGNVAEVRATVRVDLTPPAAPVLVSATPTGSSVALQWQPGPDSDLAGFIVYRNGAVANAPANVPLGDIAAYRLPATSLTYADPGLPDGTYTYDLQAFDLPGNPSPLSNSLSVTLESHAPHAIITAPAALARLSSPVDVVAEVPDADVASVQFQVRDGAASTFQPLGTPVTRVPFTAPLDPSVFTGPVLELRAVATDRAGNTDASPASIFVFLAPSPQAPSVTARVTGDQVDLSWTDPNAAGTVSGYAIERDGGSLLAAPPKPAGSTTSTDPVSQPILAYDGQSWSAWSSRVSAPSWQLDLASPVVASAVDLSLYMTSEIDVSLNVRGVWVSVHHAQESGTVAISLGDGLEIRGCRVKFLTAPSGVVGLYEAAIVPVSLASAPALHDGPLALGQHQYTVRAVSPFGLRAAGTARANVYAPSLDAPPTVVASSPLAVTGSMAAPSSSVALLRAGAQVAQAQAASDGTFAADVDLVDGTNTLVAQATDAQSNVSLPSAPVTTTYDAAPSVGIALSLSGVSGSDVALSFATSGDTGGVAGYRLTRTSGGVSTVAATLGPADREVVDRALPNGAHEYAVVAFNAHGMPGAASNMVTAVVAVPVLPAPTGLAVSPIVSGGALRLDWAFTGALSGGVLVERAASESGPFAPVNAGGLAQTTTYFDRGLVDGIPYFYRVRAVDAAGNVSDPSNIASGIPVGEIALARPRFDEPTTPDRPLVLEQTLTSVEGLADPGVSVDLRRNGIWLGVAQSGPLELVSRSVAWSSGDAGGASPDGRTIAFSSGGQLTLEGPSSRVTISDPGLTTFGRAVFSPDGASVAFEAASASDGRYHVWIASVANGQFRIATSTAGEDFAPAWSPDGTQLAYEATRPTSSDRVLGVVAVQGGAESILARTGSDLREPAWAAGGTVLAVTSAANGPSLLVGFDVATGASRELQSSPDGLHDLVVSPAGDIAAFRVDGASPRVLLMDTTSGAVATLAAGGSAIQLPTFVKSGAALAWIDDGNLVLSDLGSGPPTVVGAVGSPNRLVSTGRGLYAFSTWGEIDLVDWGGRFRFPDTTLATGANMFVAVAEDSTGHRSAPSEPISVTLDPSFLPDLAVSAAIQPQLPVVGDTVNALVTVRNGGGSASDPTALEVRILGNDDSSRSAPSVQVGALGAGTSTIALVPLDVTGLVGSERLVASVDPAGQLQDPDRSNNMTTVQFQIAPRRAIGVSLSASPTTIAAGGSTTATVAVSNPGLPQDVTVRTRLVDGSGATVVAAPDALYAPLPGGATSSFTRSLPAGTAFAGVYRVMAEVIADGSVVATASMPVTIEPDRFVRLTLVAARNTVAGSDPVDLEARVENDSTNASLVGAMYRLEVTDAQGAPVHAAPDVAVPQLWIGAQTTLATEIIGGAMRVGSYVANASVVLDGSVLARATANFSVVGRSELTGTLSVHGSQKEPPAVPLGQDVVVSYTLANEGNVSSVGVAARVLLVDPDTLAVVWQGELTPGSLGPSEATSGETRLSSAGLGFKIYGVSLVADHDGLTNDVLATARVRVADAAAPTLVVTNLAPGMFLGGSVASSVHALDSPSGTAGVRATVDGQAPAQLQLASGNSLDGMWTGSVPLGADGPHTIVFTAVDGEGNDGAALPNATDPVTIAVVSDTTPPRIAIAGVTDLSYVATTVTPTFSATDANLMSVQATFNGAPFTSGTVVATEGDYVLSAWALDRAGNRADHAVAFVVDRTPPAVALSGFIDGSFVATDVIPAFTVTEGHLDHVDAALDGLPFVAGMVATAEGFHTFSVTATDRAGNRTQQAASFTIDKTPPKIAIGGVSDGTSYAAAVSSTYSATDANLDSVTATLDGLSVTSGTTISAEGRHVLTVVALDKAANKATSTVAFTIDTTVPRVVLAGFVDGSFVSVDVFPTYTVDDIDLDSVDAQLDSVRFVSGTPVGAEGAHTLVVVAKDKAGNSSRQSGTFTIDKTAPAISLSGVTDGSFVNSSIVPVFSATDAHLTSVAGRLDGMAFASGTTVSSEGAHSLAINASDKAGNTAAKSASFTIDRTPPRIAISGVTDGEMTKVDVHPVVDVSDANLAASAVTLDGQPLVPSTVVSTEGDHVLAAQATDRAGNQASSTVQFTIDKTPPSVVVSGVSDGVHYPAAVTPTIQISDAHLSRTTLTLNGAPFVSGSIVSQDGAYTLMVHAEDTAGNATDKTVAFSIATAQQYRVTTQVGGRFGRVLALVRAGTCAPAAADLSRLDAFLQSAIVGAGRLLTVTSDESTFLEQVRSGFYDVYVLVGIPLWGKDRGCGGDSCSEQDEAADPKPWDSPPVKTRKAIARELTELTYAGHAGVISIRSRPENLPKYRELLGADLEGYVQETRFTAVGDPFAPMPDLTLGGRAVSLDLLGAIGAGHYASSSRCAGRDVAVATMTLGAGRSVTMGFDPSLATAAVGAAQALGRAVDFVMPADVVAPLAVVGVEVGVNSSANSARTIVRGSVAAPVEIVGAQPQATIDPGGTVAEWSLDLVAGQTSLVWVFPRVPDIKGKSTVTIEVRSSQPGMTAAATQAIDLVNSKTGADLLSDAFAATASLPHGGHDRLLYRQIQQDLIAVQNRIVRSRSDVEKNLSTLLDAVKSSKDLKSPGGASVRLALDELIRYWEARWFVY